MGTLTLLENGDYLTVNDCSYCATVTLRNNGNFTFRTDFLVAYSANSRSCVTELANPLRNTGAVNVEGFQYHDGNNNPLIGLASLAPWQLQRLPSRTLIQGLDNPPQGQAGLAHSKMLIVGFQIAWRPENDGGQTALNSLFASAEKIQKMQLSLEALDQGDAAFVNSEGDQYAGMFSAPIQTATLNPANSGHGGQIQFANAAEPAEHCYRIVTGNGVQYLKERTLSNSGLEQAILLQTVRKDPNAVNYGDVLTAFEPLNSTDEQSRQDALESYDQSFNYDNNGLDHDIVSVMECDNVFRRHLNVPWPWAMAEQYSNWLDSLERTPGADSWQTAATPIEVFTLVKDEQWNR